MTTVLSIVGAAVLFILFGLLRPRTDCSGHCGSCPADCALKKGEFHD